VGTTYFTHIINYFGKNRAEQVLHHKNPILLYFLFFAFNVVSFSCQKLENNGKFSTTGYWPIKSELTKNILLQKDADSSC
jgi:hypothetical protein